MCVCVRVSEVGYNDARGQFKATRPERKEKKGVALLPETIGSHFFLKICATLFNLNEKETKSVLSSILYYIHGCV
jgi:hypothetical protein